MKRAMRSFVALLLSAVTLLLAVSCGGASLDVPTGFELNEENVLSWEGVEDARTYEIEIAKAGEESGVIESTRRTYYSLNSLAEGDYDIRVRAVGGAGNDICSAWCEAFSFHRDRDMGLRFTAVANGTAYEVSGVGSAEGEVTVPATYREKPVIGIGEGAFKANLKVTKVTVEEGITYLAARAFFNCTRLTEIDLPATVTSIGEAAFQNCSALEAIELPEGLSAVANYTFAYCRSLTSLAIPSAVTSIGESAFYSCKSLADMVFPDSVKTIAGHAFEADEGLTSVTFGSGISSIGEYAFGDCAALETVKIEPLSSELVIGEYAFRHTALTSFSAPEGLTEIGAYAFYSVEPLASVSLPESLRSVGSYAFSNTKLYNDQHSATSGDYAGYVYADKWLVAVPDSVRNEDVGIPAVSPSTFREGTVGIGDSAFVGAQITGVEGSSMAEVSLPDSIRYIGKYAFQSSTLSKLVFKGVEEIGFRAFLDCEKLTNVSFGSSLKVIGKQAFVNCKMLNDYTGGAAIQLTPDSLEKIGDQAFLGSALWNSPAEDGVIYAGNWVVGASSEIQTNVVLKEDIVGISDYAFYDCEELTSVGGLGKVTRIGEWAFGNCMKLSGITLNDNLRTIEEGTFYHCGSLHSFTMPIGITEIGDFAFYYCSDLFLGDTLDLRDCTRLKRIGNRAFYGCYQMKGVRFNQGLESIGTRAFYSCENILELSLPDSLTELGEAAFAYGTLLRKLTFGTGLETIGKSAFRGCSLLWHIVLPDNIKTVSDYAFYDCAAVKDIDLGSVEHIGRFAFFGARTLTDVRLPATLKEVGDLAFGNSGLTSVTAEAPTMFGKHVFYGCALTVYLGFASSEAAAFSAQWNSLYRPEIWECELAEEGYVVSVTVAEGTVENVHAIGGFAAPGRAGYTFGGWATAEGGEAVYSAGQLAEVPAGTKLFAVWKEAAAEPDPDLSELNDDWWRPRLQDIYGSSSNYPLF